MGREPRSVLLDSKKQGLVGGKGVKSFHSLIQQKPMRVWTELTPLECEVPDCASCTVELIPLCSYIWNLSAPRSQWSVALFFFFWGGENQEIWAHMQVLTEARDVSLFSARAARTRHPLSHLSNSLFGFDFSPLELHNSGVT